MRVKTRPGESFRGKFRGKTTEGGSSRAKALPFRRRRIEGFEDFTVPGCGYRSQSSRLYTGEEKEEEAGVDAEEKTSGKHDSDEDEGGT